eukprot:TRINITY_DN39542_c0_g1_i1.p1 TRINITY_DN39542_c0_g1~~TRINITY_DN39542_c0_g1_i1.p1  ORF type:complete len:360 (+),score=50.22 TRINITY_DN39542_c0_g1_i1:134-1213(+)
MVAINRSHERLSRNAVLTALVVTSCLSTAPAEEASARELAETTTTSTPSAFHKLAEEDGWFLSREVPRQQHLLVSFFVKQTHLNELKQQLKQVSNPSSSHYGHYMTKEETDALTAPEQKDVDAVKSALADCNCKVEVDNAGAIIRANLTVAFAEQILGGQYIRLCRVDDRRTCVLRNPSAKVPQALREACDIIAPLRESLPPVRVGLPIAAPESSEGLYAGFHDALMHKKPGCCFSIGFGSFMKPCCLKEKIVSRPEQCRTRDSMGGATSFHEGACPATADEAADLMRGVKMEHISEQFLKQVKPQQGSGAQEGAEAAAAPDAGLSIYIAMVILGLCIAGLFLLAGRSSSAAREALLAS